jgi:hypothetical protein
MQTNDTPQKVLSHRLERLLIAFFLLIALSVLVVYIADPSIYTQGLSLKPSATDRYPIPATLFLAGLLAFIAVVIIGILRHWRWLFWLLLVAFGASILQIPATILQLAGILPDIFPAWYSLYRMGIALLEVGFAIWMLWIYRQYGVWGRSREHVEKQRANGTGPAG